MWGFNPKGNITSKYSSKSFRNALNVQCDLLQLMIGNYLENTKRHAEFRNTSRNSSGFRILSQMTCTFILIPVRRSIIVSARRLKTRNNAQ